MLALHDPSERLNGHGQPWMPPDTIGVSITMIPSFFLYLFLDTIKVWIFDIVFIFDHCSVA